MTDAGEWITAVIPVEGDPRGLRGCVRSLLAGTLVPRILIIADGVPAAEIEGELETDREAVTIYETGLRAGRTHALNCGLHLVQTAAALLLAPSARAGHRMTERLFAPMTEEDKCCAVQARIEDAADPDTIVSSGLLMSAGGEIRCRDAGERRRTHRSGPVAAADSRAALYNMRALEDIGLFDERLSGRQADADLGWRVMAAGGLCLYQADAAVRIDTDGDASPEERSGAVSETLYLLHKNTPEPVYGLLAPARKAALRRLERSPETGLDASAMEAALQRGRDLCLLRETEEAEKAAGASVTKRPLPKETCQESTDPRLQRVYPLYVGEKLQPAGAAMAALWRMQRQYKRDGRK